VLVRLNGVRLRANGKAERRGEIRSRGISHKDAERLPGVLD
jgi:hypothetical protein